MSQTFVETREEPRMENRTNNELILNPGEYAQMQDRTTAAVQTHCGPIVVTQSGQLRPVKFVDGRFRETSLSDCVERFVKADQGQYLVLHNPTEEEDGLKHPATRNTNSGVPTLKYGQKIVVPGPVTFALWPEQTATCVEGHNLRTNQYLIVRVYDEEAARANWASAVVKAADEDTEETFDQDAASLSLGQLLLVRGDRVSFYIPPTGIEVVPDDDGRFVRNALTLEMAEYAILVDQNGNKRYEIGPQVVFPEPTEDFFSDGRGNIKFKPIELTPTQGLHVKINCDYTDEQWPTGKRAFKEGDEIFITGETHPIYYPREEHSIVKYGDQTVHFATCVPAGKAMYVMDKATGEIVTREGPDMLLLNPIEEVLVDRVLTDAECRLMYPGNDAALEYNRNLRGEGESVIAAASASLESFGKTTRSALYAAEAALPDQMVRRTTYTKPHSVKMNDRFMGAPTLSIWTGYAVLLVKASGERRVEVGPKVVTLDYDETMAPLHLSTGKPKTTDKLLTTGYLEVGNNKVSDIVRVETLDGVELDLKLSYRVSFTGKPEAWFDVDNYVKYLCDHLRSRLKGEARRHNVSDFYVNVVAVIRDTILGKKTADAPRPGLLFEENGMRVLDIEILGVEIADSEIGDMLDRQQREVITNQIAVAREAQRLEIEKSKQSVAQQIMKLQAETKQLQHEQEVVELTAQLERLGLRGEQDVAEASNRVKVDEIKEEWRKVERANALANDTAQAELKKAVEAAMTENIVSRFKAAEGEFAQAINNLGDKQTLETVAEAMGPMRLLGGASIPEALAGVLGEDNPIIRRLTGNE